MSKSCLTCKFCQYKIDVPFTETGIPVVGTCSRVPGDWQVTDQYVCSAHERKPIDIPRMEMM